MMIEALRGSLVIGLLVLCVLLLWLRPWRVVSCLFRLVVIALACLVLYKLGRETKVAEIIWGEVRRRMPNG